MCTPRGTTDHPTTSWLSQTPPVPLCPDLYCSWSLPSGGQLLPIAPCCSMPGLPRPLVCLDSLPLTCYPFAVPASLHGMAEALQAKPSANPTAISLQQQDSILTSSSTPQSFSETASNAQVTCDYFQHHDLGLYGEPNASLTPSLQAAEGLTEPDLEPGPEFIAVGRIMQNGRKREGLWSLKARQVTCSPIGELCHQLPPHRDCSPSDQRCYKPLLLGSRAAAISPVPCELPARLGHSSLWKPPSTAHPCQGPGFTISSTRRHKTEEGRQRLKTQSGEGD